ncbi:MAG: hypothetical protein B6I25_02105 [Planctomycetales bacterium 4572_13]|nr:MAG: hypothetical protein B6I25_02105 [Planctomycetales bacterium 4572_13]
MKTRFVFYLMVSVLTISAVAAGYPEPKVVQKASQWTLDIDYSAPQQISLQLPNQAKPQRFWYIILSITNETSLDEVEFYPLCRLITDTFQVVDADKQVPIAVFNAVKRKHQGSYPFLESLDFKDHRVGRGTDNTRDFAIIWLDFDPKARQICLFVGGLSNETAVVEDPELKDEDGNPQKIFLQKTLQLKYAVAGDPKLRNAVTMKEIKQTWVMR